MTAKIIDGKSQAAAIRKQVADTILERTTQGYASPGLAVILVGNDSASQIYVSNKRTACEEVGITSFYYPLPESISTSELIELVDKLNHDKQVHGILVQLPLPPHIDSNQILEKIAPEKDVDGFHPYNLGLLAQRRTLLRPCTPRAVMALLDNIGVHYQDKHAVIIGASNIVGKPMALELLNAGCTITICHRLTMDIAKYVKQADILVSAVGNPGLIKGDWIKPGAIVIDIGITRLPNGSIAGDVDFDSARQHAAWITPVPGGVGPMTVASLLQNTLTTAINQSSNDGLTTISYNPRSN